jgi:hypothetical protein
MVDESVATMEQGEGGQGVVRTTFHRPRTCRGAAAGWMLSLVLAGFAAVPLAGSAAGSLAAPKPLFESPDTLDVVLTMPWETIEKDEFFYQGIYPAHLESAGASRAAFSFDVGVQRRGASRQVVCNFPPLKLRFDKEASRGTVFEGQKSLKLVTHCDRDNPFELYYVREMLAYRLYNLITDFSLRVRPLSVTYVDSDSRHKDGPRFALLVEDDSDVARRNGQKKINTGSISPQQLHAGQASKLALFEYMIGNADWNALSGPDPDECCDNIKLLGHDPAKDPIYAIPNDFDSSGFVNAHYARPPAGLPITRVTQRLFRGYCAHNGTLEAARQHFLAKEQDIYQVVATEARLKSAARDESLQYLKGFYAILRDPARFASETAANCRDE